MRNLGEYLRDVFRKPPMVFPLVGLFHIFGLVWVIWSDRKVPFPDVVWLQVLWVAAYTVFWLWACGLKRIGATAYIMLAVVDLIIYLAARNKLVSETFISLLFPVDVLFSLVLLYYFNRLEKKETTN